MNTLKVGFVFLLCSYLAVSASSTWSCSVPVFRYALERWPADDFAVVVFHRGPLTSEDKAVLDWLERSSSSNVPYSNYKVYTLDLAAEPEESTQEPWRDMSPPDLPWMVVRFPASSWIQQAVWSGRLTRAAARTFVDSPIRQEIARRILSGESAVWLLLESGDRVKDERAANILLAQLSDLEKTLEIPLQIYDPFDHMEDEEGSEPGLRIKFSLIRLSQDDATEELLVNMLLHSEADLGEYLSEPMAFPIYGRGRNLYALVGEGINEENVREACGFLVGPCSCQVKAMNPGTDLMMMVDWDSSLEDNFVAGWEMSQIMPALANAEDTDSNVPATGVDTTSDSGSGHVLRNILLALGVILGINALVALRVMRKTTQGE